VDGKDPDKYSEERAEKYKGMIQHISQALKLTTLKYKKLEDLVAAGGLSKEKICTYCWDSAEINQR
jgi:amidophosphoribosyltransferase